jgi:hypothetical protein
VAWSNADAEWSAGAERVFYVLLAIDVNAPIWGRVVRVAARVLFLGD